MNQSMECHKRFSTLLTLNLRPLILWFKDFLSWLVWKSTNCNLNVNNKHQKEGVFFPKSQVFMVSSFFSFNSLPADFFFRKAFCWTSKQHEIPDAEDQTTNDPLVRSTSGVVDPVGGGELVIGRIQSWQTLAVCWLKIAKKNMWWTKTNMSLQYPKVV